MLVLEAIRKSGNNVPYPLSEDWDVLGDYISDLLKEGLLSNDSGRCEISVEGKKVLLLFDADRKSLLSSMNTFVVDLMVGDTKIDGRIPLEAFKLRKVTDLELVTDHLFSVAVLIIWDDFFDMIKRLAKSKNTAWQRSMLDAFYFNAKKCARIDAWKLLGRTDNEALITGTKLTNPEIRRDLIQITRD